ncbi:(2Fe-2S)-binding protein [Paenibacillus rhizoplanae]
MRSALYPDSERTPAPYRTISIKATCCLAYQLRADHSYCSSCPILPE